MKEELVDELGADLLLELCSEGLSDGGLELVLEGLL